MTITVLQPADWVRPKGYANGMVAEGRQIYVSGQVGWDAQCRFVEGGLGAQVRQTLLNIVAILAEAGAGPEHLVRLTWYVTSRDEYYAELTEIGRAYKEVIGRNFPTMAVVQVVPVLDRKSVV